MRNPNRRTTSPWLVIATAAVTALATTVLFTAVRAWAVGDPATDDVPRTLAYQGTLDLDGSPYDGAVVMQFDLHAGTDTGLTESPVWSETLDVSVYAGRFVALLGSSSDTSAATLAAAVQAADDLYLSVTLNPGEETEAVLSNYQRFTPAPFALWTTAATDFSVGRDLVVGEDLTVRGTLDIGVVMVYCSDESLCECPEGLTALGGGIYCDENDQYIQFSNPFYNGSTRSGYDGMCRNPDGSFATPFESIVVCAPVAYSIVNN